MHEKREGLSLSVLVGKDLAVSEGFSVPTQSLSLTMGLCVSRSAGLSSSIMVPGGAGFQVGQFWEAQREVLLWASLPIPFSKLPPTPRGKPEGTVCPRLQWTAATKPTAWSHTHSQSQPRARLWPPALSASWGLEHPSTTSFTPHNPPKFQAGGA